MDKFKEIIDFNNKFLTDQDLYTFSCMMWFMEHFPNLIVKYEFIDRNNTVYPSGFADRLKDELMKYDNRGFQEWEIEGIRHFTHTYLHEWFYTFLRGIRLDAKPLMNFHQDCDGHLHGYYIGPAWRKINWEQLVMATISELYHREIGDFEKYNQGRELKYASLKHKMLMNSGVTYCDMGTRRRFSKLHHWEVLKDMCKLQQNKIDSGKNYPGQFLGTSNVLFAILLRRDYPWLKCIGTMSHQTISCVAAKYGPRDANRIMMDTWYQTYRGQLGCYLPDCLGTDAFYANFNEADARLWGSARIDSGDNYEEFTKLRDAFRKHLGTDNVTHKGVVFSNGLKVEPKTGINEPGQIHCQVKGEMSDSYGLGTTLTCGMEDESIKPLNMVIKVTACREDNEEFFTPTVKLSCDFSKATGDPATIENYKFQLSNKKKF